MPSYVSRHCHSIAATIKKTSPCIFRVIKSTGLRWSGHEVRIEEGASVFRILTGKFTGESPLERPGHRWEDNIRIDVNTRELAYSARGEDYWIALVNAALNLRVP